MKFSVKTAYGLRAILYLADHFGQRSVSASQIAKEEKIPVPYLEQILHHLKRKHWIKSLRGPSGGYVLAKKPSEIMLGALLKDLEGNPKGSLAPERDAPKRSISALACGIFWQSLGTHLDEFLGSISIKTLIDEATRHRQSKSDQGRLNFNI